MEGDKALKPCPFCGADYARLEHDKNDYQNRRAWVECKHCGANTGKLEADAGYCADQIIIARWNLRVEQPNV